MENDYIEIQDGKHFCSTECWRKYYRVDTKDTTGGTNTGRPQADGGKMVKHKIKDKTYEYRQFDDCILYRIFCSCGEVCGGWTPQEAEEEYKNHLSTFAKGKRNIISVK